MPGFFNFCLTTRNGSHSSKPHLCMQFSDDKLRLAEKNDQLSIKVKWLAQSGKIIINFNMNQLM
jgi:hypothetical protein